MTTGAVGIRNSTDAELYADTTYLSYNGALYAQLDKKLWSKLNISAGFRYEINQLQAPDSIPVATGFISGGTDTATKPVFRLGASYQVNKASYIRASWGQGFRFPTIAEKYISADVGFPISPNPDLKSEFGETAELGFKQGLKIRNWSGFIDIAGFWSKYKDMLEFNLFPGTNQDPLPTFKSVNIGDTKIFGFDFSIGGFGKINDIGFNLIGGYTYLVPKYINYDERGFNLPLSEIDPISQPELYNAWASSDQSNILKYRIEHSFKLDIQTDYKYGP